MRVCFYGSCQTTALCEALRASAPTTVDGRGLELFACTNWEYITSGRPLPDRLWECDVLVYQPYHGTGSNLPYSTDVVRSRLKALKGADAIAIPFMSFDTYYFGGYGRDPRDRAGLFGRFPSVPPQLVSATEVSPCLAALQDPDLFREADLCRSLETDMAHIRRRDGECDVKIGDYVERNWRDVQLFWSSQHPSQPLLQHVMDQLAERLTVAVVPTVPKDALKSHAAPILPSVVRHLGLNFTPEQRWEKGPSVSLEEFVQEFVRHCDDTESS